MNKKSIGGNLLLLVAALFWGLGFSTQKVAGEHLPAYFINGSRFLLGALVLFLVIPLFDRIRRNGRHMISPRNRYLFGVTVTELIGGAICGVVLLSATTLQQFALAGASPGKASFLTALYVVFVPFIGLARHKVAKPNVWFSVLIAIVGAYLLTSGGMGGLSLNVYDYLLFGAAALFAVHITVIDIYAPRVDGIRLSMIQFAVAGIIALPISAFQGPFTGADFTAALPSLLYLGICSCGIAYTSQIVGQQLSGTPTVASLIMSLESVVGLLGGVIFLGDTLTVYQSAGCVVIFFAVIFSEVPLDVWVARVRRAPTADAPSPTSLATAPTVTAGPTAEAAEFTELASPATPGGQHEPRVLPVDGTDAPAADNAAGKSGETDK